MSALQKMLVTGTPSPAHLKFHRVQCGKCKVAIIRCRDAKGRLMAVDADPSELGTIDLYRTSRGLGATRPKRAPLFELPRLLHTDHSTTCSRRKP